MRMTNFSVSSAERGLAILELLIDQPDGLPMSTIAQRLELPVSATHRLLTMLVQKRYVRQSTLTERYMATMLLAAHGLRLLEISNLSGACQPLLEELATQCEELVRLAVLENEHLTWVAKAQGARNSIRYDPISGRDVPLHATAMGKAWLATLPEDHAIRLVQERGMGGDLVGPNVIRTPDALREQLRLTRERGFAIVEEEAEPGISAVATVVRDLSVASHPVVGTISIGGPSFRMNRARLVSFRDPLTQTAQRLSEIWPVHIYQNRHVA
jgi:IclR family transcriptional regulator, acetate operon repressor